MKANRDGDEGRREGGGKCFCPFCDAELEKVYPFCEECGKQMNRCSKCGKPISPNQETCPDCR